MAVAVVVAVCVTIAVDRIDSSPALDRHLAPAIVAVLLGLVVGASEILSRYRDEPLRAVVTRPGLMYLGLNGVISGLTYGVLIRYGKSIAPALSDDRLLTAIVAGFAAMAILRSKFFTIRTPKGDAIAVGPDAAVAAFLDAADRGVDRSRAVRRLALVTERASQVSSAAVAREYFDISLAAFQNLDEDERAAVINRMDTVAASVYPDELKLQAMCYAILVLTGERNFADIMTNLQEYEANL